MSQSTTSSRPLRRQRAASVRRALLPPAAARDTAPAAILPPPFEAWFEQRKWQVRPHQRALIQKAEKGRSTLLIAPTGAGKTLAGFLPSLIEIASARVGQSK